jgi:hypothetical protein
MVLVYRAAGQLIKVRVFMIVSLVGMVLCLWWGLDLARTHGVNEADGGALAPLPERLAWGSLVALLGIAFAAGMWLYGRHYAVRIEFDVDNKQVHLDTVGFFGNRHHVIDVADLGSVRSRGDVNWGAVAAAAAVGQPIALVDAPWKSVRIKGWRLPLIVDTQGVVLHPKLMRTLFRDR